MSGYVRTLEVSACSSAGVFLQIDQRIYEDATLNADVDRIVTWMNTYSDEFEWRPLADALVSEFQGKWQRKIEVSWPEPLGPVRPLPDSVKSCE
jgi:hypothetical protein